VLTFCWFPGVDRWRNSSSCSTLRVALFAVSGTQKALALGLNPVMAALLGMVTGIGGGMVRNVLVARDLTVLRADLYAVAALAGAAVVVAGSLLHIPSTATMIAGAALCFGLRLMAIRRGWQLPTAVLASILRTSLELRNTGTKRMARSKAADLLRVLLTTEYLDLLGETKQRIILTPATRPEHGIQD
jgi:glycine transporter